MNYHFVINKTIHLHLIICLEHTFGCDAPYIAAPSRGGSCNACDEIVYVFRRGQPDRHSHVYHCGLGFSPVSIGAVQFELSTQLRHSHRDRCHSRRPWFFWLYALCTAKNSTHHLLWR